MFDEIDGRPGWYAGATWQMPGWGKVSVIRYDNQGDPYARTSRDAGWNTRFWSVGARTDIGGVMLIAQAMRGQTIVAGPSFYSDTKFQSAFLLASYDLDDWRFSAREDLFATRRAGARNTLRSEDGDAFTASISWSRFAWLRLTGEVIALNSRRGEYVPRRTGSEPRRYPGAVQHALLLLDDPFGLAVQRHQIEFASQVRMAFGHLRS